RHAVEFNTLTVVNSRNAQQPLEVYRFLKEIGSGFMQFIPLVERIASGATADGLVRIKPADADDDEPMPAAVAEWSVGSSQYGDFLCGIYDYWVRHDVGKQFIQMFDVALQIWAGAGAGLCVFAETCGTAMALEHTGDLYSCDHFVYPDNLLGNILETPMSTLVASPQQVAFGQNKRDLLPRYCRECDVRFACNGECPKHRFLTTPDGEYGLNYLCASYKHFFHHVADSMEFMVNELNAQRAPANVMKWMAGQDLMVSGGAKPSRNSPCICGSGKKTKQCCGRDNFPTL
ncbi:MAG: SPASM domain-containing protein, partial [Acidobacteriaceae bacterium]|nr:SPASM domain-containing protein [Acidobacteriaceae bacterium]